MLNIIMFTKLAESVGRHCTNIVLAEPRPIAIIFYINFKVSTFNLTFNNDVYIFLNKKQYSNPFKITILYANCIPLQNNFS